MGIAHPTKNCLTYTATYTINWTNLTGDDYKYNVTSCDLFNNCNSTSTRAITIITSQDTITLNSGWNLISLPMKNKEAGTDRNISVVKGWNLIGYSGDENITLDDTTFTNSSGSRHTWNDAVTKNKVKAYLSYYENSDTNPKNKKYKHAASSDLEMDDSKLKNKKGYWLYANESGNITLPGVGGTRSGQTYRWDKLRFSNGSDEKTISQAYSNNWILDIRYLEEDQFYYIDDSGDIGTKNYFSSLEGVFIKSSKDNLVLVRQN